MVSIRLATCEDAHAIGKVHWASWQTTYRGIGIDEFLDSVSVDNRVAMWTRNLCDPASQSFAYVAEVDGKIVGFAAGGAERGGDTEYKGELYSMYLLQAHQRRRIGQRLVHAVGRRLSELGFSSMLIWVLAVNPARFFYEACGGKAVRQKPIELGGKMFDSVGYGWQDLALFAKDNQDAS